MSRPLDKKEKFISCVREANRRDRIDCDKGLFSAFLIAVVLTIIIWLIGLCFGKNIFVF